MFFTAILLYTVHCSSVNLDQASIPGNRYWYVCSCARARYSTGHVCGLALPGPLGCERAQRIVGHLSHICLISRHMPLTYDVHAFNAHGNEPTFGVGVSINKTSTLYINVQYARTMAHTVEHTFRALIYDAHSRKCIWVYATY